MIEVSTLPTRNKSTHCYKYWLAEKHLLSIANDCDASTARVATILQTAATSFIIYYQTYELSARPSPSISRQ
ncbi:hypothetical protein L9F63_017992 [Diploptera punctata]|uniref:Uncharacterized protein n=1 Tax=Diploptera punctata TaxID=6984 RepID=A0AAD8EFK4_DIPPU|nr:hypothetical protein L9F63_017992 [Diploptera punctata]